MAESCAQTRLILERADLALFIIQYPARERDHRDFHSLKLDIQPVKSPCSEIAYSRDSVIPISAIESWLSKLLKMSAAFLFEIFTH